MKSRLFLFPLFILSMAFPLHANINFYGGSLKNMQGADTLLRYDTNGDGTPDIIMADNGYLGIGTLSPQGNLHVVGNIFIEDGNESSGRVLASDGNGKGAWTDLSTLTGAWALSNGNVYRASGWVGIGTAAPAQTLHIDGNVLIGDGSADTPALSFQNDTNTGFFLDGTGNLQFVTNGTNRLIIDDGGNVGIGTDSPSVRLDIIGGGEKISIPSSGVALSTTAVSGYSIIDIGGSGINGGYYRLLKGATPAWAVTNNVTTDAWTLYSYVKSDSIITAKNTGNIGIGVTTPSAKLHIAGNVLFAGNLLPETHNSYDIGRSGLAMRSIYTTDLVVVSDRRLKCDIAPLERGLNKVLSLEPVSYRFDKGEKKKRLGFIAQDTDKIVPEVVDVGSDASRTLGIRYTELIPVLVRAIQEQQRDFENKIEAQQKTIEEQKRLNVRFMNAIEELRANQGI
ncbi:MAG: tail fiber domain-containing protein [Planctomycetes bacterium]|nr:tail fiber domain-containing protein [Planctomycetota bacterium]